MDATEGGTAAPASVSDHPLGPDAVAILATEHWSLIGHRSLLWNEAYSRTTIFLGALSAAIVALALVVNATGLGPRAVTLALVLLPVVLFLGIATHLRVVEINQAEIELMLAMNRLRNAYLRIAPALEPYFSTSPHDDERGLTASYLLSSLHDRALRPWTRFLVNTPTVIATVDAALAAAIAVLAVQKAGAATTLAVAVGVAAFLVVWTALFLLQRQSLSPLRRSKPRFPTTSVESLSGPGWPYLRSAHRPQGPHDQRGRSLTTSGACATTGSSNAPGHTFRYRFTDTGCVPPSTSPASTTGCCAPARPRSPIPSLSDSCSSPARTRRRSRLTSWQRSFLAYPSRVADEFEVSSTR
jgi:hypothetical protein